MNPGCVILPCILVIGVLVVMYSRSMTDHSNSLRRHTPRWFLAIFEPQPRSPIPLIVVGALFAVLSFWAGLGLLLQMLR